MDPAFRSAHAQVTAAIGSRLSVLNPLQLSETESATIPDESGPEKPVADTANEQTKHVTVEENKIEEDPWIDSPENRFILSLGEEEERELNEAMTCSPQETICAVEECEFAQPPPFKNAWDTAKLPRAIFEPPPNTYDSQKSPTVQRKTMKMRDQPTSQNQFLLAKFTN